MSRKRMPFVLVVSGVLISLSAFPQKSLNKPESTGRASAGLLKGGTNNYIRDLMTRTQQLTEAPTGEAVKPRKQKRFAARTVGSVNAFSRQRGFEIQ